MNFIVPQGVGQAVAGVEVDSAGPAASAPGVIHRLPVIEERLSVQKRIVDRGGYRVTKRVSTTEEIVDEALTSSTVQIERRPVGRLLNSLVAPEPYHDGDTLVMSVVKEVLVTEKRLMLVEEVRISRTEASYREPQRISLRKEDIFIERLDAESSE